MRKIGHLARRSSSTYLPMCIQAATELEATCVQVAHITGEVEFLDSAGGKVERGWAAGQVATTADFSHGSWLWTHFSGGLNYQVMPKTPNAFGGHHPLLWTRCCSDLALA